MLTHHYSPKETRLPAREGSTRVTTCRDCGVLRARELDASGVEIETVWIRPTLEARTSLREPPCLRPAGHPAPWSAAFREPAEPRRLDEGS